MRSRLPHLTLAQKFMLVSLVILASGMTGVAWWVGAQIKAGVIHRTAGTTALFVNSFISPYLQSLGPRHELGPGSRKSLDRLLRDTPLGHQIVAFKVWGPDGHVLYSTSPRIAGKRFPISDDLRHALDGKVASEISDLTKPENRVERQRYHQLIETYSPVYLHGTNRVIAVAEFYTSMHDLQSEIDAAQRRSWLVVALATVVMYLLLAAMVKRASDTIERQQAQLRDKVEELRRLLDQNEELNQRVRLAARRTTALNERFLRRVSADLHDGPAQNLSHALLRLDTVIAACAAHPDLPDVQRCSVELDKIQLSLNEAMRDVRAISADLRLPELERLTPAETVTRAVRSHERRTDTAVNLDAADLPEEASLPIKITLYRVVQEALNNAYQHAGGVGQHVRARREDDHLCLEINDHGAGFVNPPLSSANGHLGLVGMRERVESLGGHFQILSEPGKGTRVVADLPLHPTEKVDE